MPLHMGGLSSAVSLAVLYAPTAPFSSSQVALIISRRNQCLEQCPALRGSAVPAEGMNPPFNLDANCPGHAVYFHPPIDSPGLWSFKSLCVLFNIFFS